MLRERVSMLLVQSFEDIFDVTVYRAGSQEEPRTKSKRGIFPLREAVQDSGTFIRHWNPR